MAYDPFWRTRPLQYAVEFIYSLVVAVWWAPALAVRRLGRVLREIGSENWQRANGSITAGDVTVIHGWIVDYALGRLDYSYTVAGDFYAGSFTRQYPDEQSAWDFVDANRGKHVIVRYKTNNAQASTLRDADQDLSWNGISDPSVLAMVWQHWRDELRTEQQVHSDDEHLKEDADTKDGEDIVHR